MEETYPTKKRAWGTLTKAWGSPRYVRDAIVDLRQPAGPQRTEIPARRVRRLARDSPPASSMTGEPRYGLGQRAQRPGSSRLVAGSPGRSKAILDFHAKTHPIEGYRRLAFMMLDSDVVAVSPSSVYRVLLGRRIDQAHTTANLHFKGKGFVQQPLRPHEHWHVDISYPQRCRHVLLTSAACSMAVAGSSSHWEIRESMTEAEVETIIQRARERVIPTPAPGSSRTTGRSSSPRTSRSSSGSVE